MDFLLVYNQSTLEAGILVQDLPKTFREAVQVATALGYTYIWIDSLCIIQDSKDDWEKESPTMHQVYGGAVFNIAATASSDCDGGLFRPRYKPEFGQTIVSLGFDGFPTIEAVLSSHALDRSLSYKDTQNLVGLLLDRGWVVQERITAKRVIHFGPGGIWFECSVTQACEKFPIAVSSNLMDLKQQSILNLAKGDNTIDKWVKIVEKFSSSSLTFDKDKLVALSGLAKIFRDSTGYRYLAGIFDCREKFVHQLSWYGGWLNPAKRPKDFRAPTWSWASVNLGVSFKYLGTDTQSFEILDASVIPRSFDDTSELSSGMLRLKGVLRAIDIQLESKTVSFISEAAQHLQFLRDADEHIQTNRAHAFLIVAGEFNQYLVLQPTAYRRGQFRRVGMCRFISIQ